MGAHRVGDPVPLSWKAALCFQCPWQVHVHRAHFHMVSWSCFEIHNWCVCGTRLWPVTVMVSSGNVLIFLHSFLVLRILWSPRPDALPTSLVSLCFLFSAPWKSFLGNISKHVLAIFPSHEIYINWKAWGIGCLGIEFSE